VESVALKWGRANAEAGIYRRLSASVRVRAYRIEGLVIVEKNTPKTVFYAVLDMGLGHATRSLPLIREFLRLQWQVVIGGNGRSLTYLKQEAEGARFVELPDYGFKYSSGGVT